MRLALTLLFIAAGLNGAGAQPADCAAELSAGPTVPLALDLGGRAGVPSGTTGFVNVPLVPPGTACRDASPPPSDVLHGEPGDLLRGAGIPHVTVEVQ